MKKCIGVMVTVVIALSLAASVLAATLGISPSSIEVTVPGEGSATTTFQVHFFRGDIKVSLVDIPLSVEPQVLHVDAIDEPQDIEVTIYGDESLGSQIYNGYIRFLGMSGETVAVAIKIKANVTNIVKGQPLPEESPVEEPAAEKSTAEEPAVEKSAAEGPPLPETAPSGQGAIGDLPLSTVILIAGGLVFLGLVILAISLAVRRPRY
jgi:hypothetical protein